MPDRGPEDQATLLLALARRVSRTLDRQEVLDESLAALRQLVDFGGGAIQLIHEGALMAVAADPPLAPEALTVRIPVGQGVSGTIAATGETIYIPDITIDARVFPEGRKRGVSTGVRSYLGAPLIAKGEIMGVLQIDAPTVDAFDPATRALVLAFVPTICAAVQNAQLFEQEREAARRMREADQLREDFLSIVSHELRTPMTVILGLSQTLAERAGELPAEQVVRVSEKTFGAATRLKRLIEDLLDVSQFERGFVEVIVGPTSVGAVLKRLMSERAGIDDHPLLLDMPKDAPPVMADDERLLQVLINLVDNASKFSPAGAPVTIRAEVDLDRVVISVEDRGQGIPPWARDRIFALFHQEDEVSTRTVGGMGVGLYIVKRLSDAMGASVGVAEREGGGTRMTVALRRADLP